MIIALDGPAGSGKSTIAKLIASDLNINYLDTGAMYRIVTLYCLENEIDIKLDIKATLKKIKINIVNDKFYLNDEDVSEKIRTIEVSNKVSEIAAIKEVRDFLVSEQREISQNSSCILDGRDIGTVVFPEADFKFFLTANPEVRAKRRSENEGLDYEEVLKNIIKRDEIDTTRKESPLKKASDAIEVDSSNLTINEVKENIISKVR